MKKIISKILMNIMLLAVLVNSSVFYSHAGNFLKPLEEYPGYLGTDEYGNTYWQGSGAWHDEYGRSGAELYHQDKEWEKNPKTIFNDGLYEYYSDGRVIPVKEKGVIKRSSAPVCNHDYKQEVTKEADCAAKGEMTYTCSKCGHAYTEEIEKNDDHDYVEEITKEAKCEVTGVKICTCSRCGDAYEEEIPALSHEYNEEVTKEAGCEDNGVKTFTCNLCGDTYKEEILAIGHDDGEWVTTVEPKWFSKGSESRRCTRCDKELEVSELDSIYPMWVLYCGIGVVAAIVLILGTIFMKKKNTK